LLRCARRDSNPRRSAPRAIPLALVDADQRGAVYTVSRELSHSSTGMVEAVYSHLGEVRPRGEVVEFRGEHFADILEERVRALRLGTTGGTTRSDLRSESATACRT
jgi:hypothetical protein